MTLAEGLLVVFVVIPALLFVAGLVGATVLLVGRAVADLFRGR